MKKSKKEPFQKFIVDFKNKYCSGLEKSDYWKKDFLESYGFVWVRWYENKKDEDIISDLLDHLRSKELADRDGIFYIKMKGEAIRITCKSKENLAMWQKILFLRMSPSSNVLVTEAGNLTFDIELTDIERKIINEDFKTKGLRTIKQ